ncbi:MAG: cyclodeaminase/cyclohydrolase family protein [Bacillota bacterium]
MKLTENSLVEFSQKVADDNPPVPAGGSAIGATALLGVSLIKLSYQVSCDDYPPLLTTINEELMEAINKDPQVYQLNLTNNFQDLTALKKIIKIPLSIAELSAAALEIANQLTCQLKDSVAADYKIGIINLEASLQGALAVVESNYYHFASEDKFIKKTKKKVKKLKNKLSN